VLWVVETGEVLLGCVMRVEKEVVAMPRDSRDVETRLEGFAEVLSLSSQSSDLGTEREQVECGRQNCGRENRNRYVHGAGPRT
jgi:hypothetical protein